jgi:hypothetical protein
MKSSSVIDWDNWINRTFWFSYLCANIKYYFNINIYKIIIALIDIHTGNKLEIPENLFDSIIEQIIEGEFVEEPIEISSEDDESE